METTFGELVAEAMRRKRWGDYHVSAAIGLLPDNKVINNTQIRRIRTGERQHLTRDLVERLIDVLGLDPAEAWAAAGLLPPGVTADMLRRLELVATTPRAVSPGRHSLGDDRRRSDRRRLHLVPPVAA